MRPSSDTTLRGLSGEPFNSDNASTKVSLMDPRLRDGRKAFLKAAALGLALTTLCMFAVLPIYWGSYFRLPDNLYRLTVGLIDLDSPGAAATGRMAVLGPALISAPSRITYKYKVGYTTLDNTQFDISGATGGNPRGVDVHQWAAEAVQNEDYFAVVIANANATSAAVSAFEQLVGGAQTSYMAQGALTLYYSEGRNFETVDQWLTPDITRLINTYTVPQASRELVAQLAPRLAGLGDAAYAGINQTALSSVLSRPFSQATWNLRPVDEFAGIPATTVGMLYLLVFTYFVSLFAFNARQSIENKLRLGDLIALRLLVPVVQYLFISLWISLVTLVFKVSFERFYGHGGFPLFWCSNFLAQWAAGMPMEVALSLLGPKYTAFFLILWIILNISPVFYDIANLDHFYSYGFVTPIYQAVQNGKTIIFGTKQRFGQYFGVEIAWVVVGTLVLVAVIVVQRRKAERQAREEQAQRKEGKAQ
ncbi:uncharacterized protein RHOBADRAFT_51362 [Rhodotorula graminis WP1]|uniref:DUF3533 domain-containing protein n=1 Tax=Rhodotorula graminis (strain WP1) TaxID=578459 RepID=A0A194S9X4_RHOGW|nr:uncharacterized protein RHOBADRAFT_51362 [Rhodotorula graminis WP1]KPV77518.1 hypothetical protein RHOBADRAFT_51362 [Rhodotorula graminis WP1]